MLNFKHKSNFSTRFHLCGHFIGIHATALQLTKDLSTRSTNIHTPPKVLIRNFRIILSNEDKLSIEYYKKIRKNIKPFDWQKYSTKLLETSKQEPYTEIRYFIIRDNLLYSTITHNKDKNKLVENIKKFNRGYLLEECKHTLQLSPFENNKRNIKESNEEEKNILEKIENTIEKENIELIPSIKEVSLQESISKILWLIQHPVIIFIGIVIIFLVGKILSWYIKLKILKRNDENIK